MIKDAFNILTVFKAIGALLRQEVQEMAHLTVLRGSPFGVTACKKLWVHLYLEIIVIYRKNSMNFNAKIGNLSIN